EDSYLIRVALELPNAEHAATIVNAVVESYLGYNKDYKHSANAQLKASLKLQHEKLQNDIRTKYHELQALHQKGTVEFAKPNPALSISTSNEDPAQPTFSSRTEGAAIPPAVGDSIRDPAHPMFLSLPEESFQQIVDQAVKAEIAYLDAVSNLEA